MREPQAPHRLPACGARVRWRLGARAGALVGLILLGTSAVAAPAFEDTMAQRTLACTACHGKQGRAGPDGYYPRLAGKPAGYLYNQLLNFRDGRRHYGLMTRMVDLLSDAYLLEIATYFADMQAPYAPPAPLARPLPTQVMQRGRTLALDGDPSQRLPACAQCHGARLMGVQPNFPALLGLPADYLVAQLGGWKTGERRAHAPDCMARIAQRLSDADAYAVVSWLASQPVPTNPHPDPEPTAAPALPADLTCGSVPPPGAPAQ